MAEGGESGTPMKKMLAMVSKRSVRKRKSGASPRKKANTEPERDDTATAINRKGDESLIVEINKSFRNIRKGASRRIKKLTPSKRKESKPRAELSDVQPDATPKEKTPQSSDSGSQPESSDGPNEEKKTDKEKEPPAPKSDTNKSHRSARKSRSIRGHRKKYEPAVKKKREQASSGSDTPALSLRERLIQAAASQIPDSSDGPNEEKEKEKEKEKGSMKEKEKEKGSMKEKEKEKGSMKEKEKGSIRVDDKQKEKDKESDKCSNKDGEKDKDKSIHTNLSAKERKKKKAKNQSEESAEEELDPDPFFEFGEVVDGFDRGNYAEEVFQRSLLKKVNIPIINRNLARLSTADVRRMLEYVARMERIRMYEIIRDSSNKEAIPYKVLETLGQGRFSFVLTSERPGNEFRATEQFLAIKIEKLPKMCSPGFHREIQVLRRLRMLMESADGNAPRYFPVIEDAGVFKNLNFICMNMCGADLDYIHRKSLQRAKRISLRTILNIAVESLLAIQELHKAGYIHRNVKPSNFCVGIEKSACIRVVLIDFAGCARIPNNSATDKSKKKDLSESAKNVPDNFFYVRDRTSAKYWPPELHHREPHTRNSDVFSWLIMVLDLYSRRRVTWRRKPDRQMLDAKLVFFSDREPRDPKPLPEAINKLFDEFKSSTGGVTNDASANPCYEQLLTVMNEAKQKYNSDTNYKPEWLRPKLENDVDVKN